MAGRPGKKAQPPPKPFDEFADETDGFDDDAPAVDPKAVAVASARRDWRDVEKFREERELRKLIGEDFDDPFAERPTRRPGN
ncbi:MAG: hypothetical protein QE272_03785 [Nevskia sp.]|nr:hypothetical protein [Gammaproteobacteria bacterium]MDH4457802.1 hypothetical protein [Nevskia sp.]